MTGDSFAILRKGKIKFLAYDYQVHICLFLLPTLLPANGFLFFSFLFWTCSLIEWGLKGIDPLSQLSEYNFCYEKGFIQFSWSCYICKCLEEYCNCGHVPYQGQENQITKTVSFKYVNITCTRPGSLVRS